MVFCKKICCIEKIEDENDGSCCVLDLADQTPTPTRFLKNCEEVGLFNELATSFEHEFCKAQEDDQRTKHSVRKQVNVFF